jgi:hypothetical protein
VKNLLYLRLQLFFALGFSRVFANTLVGEAENRGIDSTCLSHLTQLEDYHNLDGLNITFAHSADPSNHPSLHTSSKNTIMEALFRCDAFSR